MYERAFKLEIVTPRRVVFQAEATSFSAPGSKGGFQVLFNHAPLLSSLEVGQLRVKLKDGSDTLYSTSGGFVEVKDNTVVALVESAERSDEIDLERAKKSKERALQRIHTHEKDIDLERAQASLARALNRIRTAQADR